MDVVDTEEESSSSKSLVERLEEAPQKIFDVMTATSKNSNPHDKSCQVILVSV